MHDDYTAVVAGHICLDVIPDLTKTIGGDLSRMLMPGRLLEVGPASFSTGGPVSNTGLALERLGIKTLLIGKIGDDVFGRAVREIVASHGVHLLDGIISDSAASTSYSVVINPPEIDRVILHCPGANDTFGASDIPYERLRSAKLFLFGYPPLLKRMFENHGDELVRVFRRAKETGITTSLDFSLPDPASASGGADWSSILRATLPYVDIFMPSIEELLFILRRDEYEEFTRSVASNGTPHRFSSKLLSDLGNSCLEMGAKIVGIKLGDQGLYFRTGTLPVIQALGRACPTEPYGWGDREVWAPCFKVNVAGTTGSGDATIAGMLSALLHGLPFEEAIRMAVAVGACNVEAHDALSGIRSWDETRHRIAVGWPVHRLPLEGSTWKFDPGHQLWIGPHNASPIPEV